MFFLSRSSRVASSLEYSQRSTVRECLRVSDNTRFLGFLLPCELVARPGIARRRLTVRYLLLPRVACCA